MAVLEALQTAVGAVRRNPALFVVAAAFSLLQLPGLVAQSLSPFVGGLVSLGFSGITIFVTPFFFGGVIGMANEAIDGRTSIGTFIGEGKANYVPVLVVYLCLFAVNLVLGFVIVFAVIVGGLLFFQSGGQLHTGPLVALGAIGLLALLGYLVVAFAVQFFGHAIVVDDRRAVEGVKRSAWCVRHNLVAVVGYTLVTAAAGAAFGLFGALFSLLTSPRLSGPGRGTGVDGATATPLANSLPVDIPAVGLAGTVGLVVLLVVCSGLFGGFFAAFSTAFYRRIRPTG
jgi:hypothetical protein